jgi:hypothetical protein
MQTQDKQIIEKPQPPKPNRKLLAAVAAFSVAVIAAVVIAALIAADNDRDVVDVPPTTIPATSTTLAESTVITEGVAPVDIGRSFFEAQDAWDAEAAIALFAPNAVTNVVTEVEEYPSYFAWLETLDWRYTVEECKRRTVGPPVKVDCSYSYENAWTQALGVGPYSGSSMRFFIADGQIQELRNSFISDRNGFSVQAWEVFREWVRDTHPENLNVMYDLGIEGRTADVPIVTPEALALWEQYTNEFVASVAP